MVLCSECPKRHECKSICEAVKKEIAGRGKTAARKPKTYPVDFSYIEDTHNTLNSFQVDVLSAIKSLTLGTKEEIVLKLVIEEAISKVLDGKEKQVIQLFMKEYRQKEIAKNLGISQPRVNFLLKRALGKLKNFLEGL